MRISCESSFSHSLVELINNINPLFKASINRQKQIILDLSKERSDWERHCDQIIDGVSIILPILSRAQNHIIKSVVDISVEVPASRQKEGISFSIYTFPADFLSLLGTNNISLEVSIS